MRPMPMVRFTHDVTKIAAFRCDQLGETIEDEASFAQIARRAAERLSRLACHGSRYAVLEVGGFVSREEKPRSGANTLRIENVGLPDTDGCNRLHIGHA